MLAYLEPCKTSKMELLAKKVNALSIFAKSSVLYAWQSSEYASQVIFDLLKLKTDVWNIGQRHFKITYETAKSLAFYQEEKFE